MQINRSKFLNSIAMALDFLEMDTLKKVTNHNRRIALICLKIGREIGMNDEDLSDLQAYAILHDNGKSKYPTFDTSYIESTNMTGILGHCLAGEKNMETLSFCRKRENILLYHHEEYNGTGPFGLEGENIPFFSQIIHLADVSEVLYRRTENRKEVLDNIVKNKGICFSKQLVEIFLHVQNKPAFWFGMESEYIKNELQLVAPAVYVTYDIKHILGFAKLLAKIIDGKSPFTWRHTSELSEKTIRMAAYYNFDTIKTDKLKIAAGLHDIGKLAVSNNILEKPGPLTPSEFAVMKKHTYLTRQLTSFSKEFSDISDWAWMHHENLDGTGYPYGITGSQMPFESQLLAVLDKYQALTETRPYRGPVSHEKTVKILRDLAMQGKINAIIVEDVAEVFKNDKL